MNSRSPRSTRPRSNTSMPFTATGRSRRRRGCCTAEACLLERPDGAMLDGTTGLLVRQHGSRPKANRGGRLQNRRRRWTTRRRSAWRIRSRSRPPRRIDESRTGGAGDVFFTNSGPVGRYGDQNSADLSPCQGGPDADIIVAGNTAITASTSAARWRAASPQSQGVPERVCAASTTYVPRTTSRATPSPGPAGARCRVR